VHGISVTAYQRGVSGTPTCMVESNRSFVGLLMHKSLAGVHGISVTAYQRGVSGTPTCMVESNRSLVGLLMHKSLAAFAFGAASVRFNIPRRLAMNHTGVKSTRGSFF